MSAFMAPSPRERLRAHFASHRSRSLQRPNTDTAARTLGFTHFRPGVLVREKGGTHVARIDAILWSVEARVAFLDTGWRADYRLDDLELATDELEQIDA